MFNRFTWKKSDAEKGDSKYLLSDNFICVRGPVICVQQNSTPKLEPKPLGFMLFASRKAPFLLASVFYALLEKFMLVRGPVMLFREGVTLAQKNLCSFSGQLRSFNKIRQY